MMAENLTVGDVIKVPQYKNALKVSHVGEIEAFNSVRIGLEFVEGETDTMKSLSVNRDTGVVSLQAGTVDKGEVSSIDKLN